jgi:hypothetical protein
MIELPNEIWITIILHLNILDLAGWRCSMRQFHAIYADEYHWQCRLKHQFESDPTVLRQPGPGFSSKQLYRYWSKQRSRPCRRFKFNTEERPGLNRMNAKIKRSLLADGLQTGDIVEYAKDPTEGYIYDGTQFHFLSLWRQEIIPGLEVVEDFPVMHWSQYYESVPLNWSSHRDELIKNFEFIRMQNQFHSQCLHRTHFTHWTGQRYVILILRQSSYAITPEVFTKYVNSIDVITCHVTTSKQAKYFKNVRHVPENPNQIMYLINPDIRPFESH